ncbi:hypothetical protein [Mycoplasma elephantis]|uniref:hypothetical protein n=1 Tax=Mycoplasma elephantis TaxID=114882 RepID=UPI00056AA4B1|nr:hypothetical protein [Mycoplasma elephantis]
MIAISGDPFSGKTHLLNKLRDKGFICFSCDEFVDSIYKNNTEITKLFDLLNIKLIEYKNLKQHISSLITINENREIIENFFYSRIYKHLQNNKYDFVEIPVIKNNEFDFKNLFSKTVFINTSEKMKNERAKKRYSSSKQINLIKTLSNTKQKINFDVVINGNCDILIDDFLKKINQNQ